MSATGVCHDRPRNPNGLQLRPGTPTTEIRNADGVAIAWDLIEETAREIGIVQTALRYKVKAATIRMRASVHKWKKIPDGRTLVAGVQGRNIAQNGSDSDLSRHIPAHRERVFKTASDSLGKKKIIPIRSAKDYDIVDRIARRALGIDDNEGGNQQVLIKINEAIEDHALKPIEAHEFNAPLHPVTTESQHSLGNESQSRDAGAQDDSLGNARMDDDGAPIH